VEVLAEVHGRWLTGEVLAVVAEDGPLWRAGLELTE
jgi:hypothetical protein